MLFLDMIPFLEVCWRLGKLVGLFLPTSATQQPFYFVKCSQWQHGNTVHFKMGSSCGSELKTNSGDVVSLFNMCLCIVLW